METSGVSENRIFRKVALERLASPDRLDELIQITDARGWIALGALGMLLATALGWGFFGTLREKVAGSGVLVRSGGVLEVVANASGRVTDVRVAAGDLVSEGDVVAWITQPELLDQLEETRERLRTLRARQEDGASFARQQAALELASIEGRRRDLGQSIAADSERLRSLLERLEAEEELLGKGLIARPTLLATHREVDLTREKIRDAENGLRRVAVDELTLDNRLRESLRTGAREVELARDEVAQLERRLAATSRAISEYTGRILEVMTEPGQIVQRGEPVLSLDLAGGAIQELVLVLYVPSLYGKRIQAGMEIHVAPSTVPQEEYGMMVGRVTYASSYPSSPRGMMRVLKNEQLVQALAGSGPPYEVHAELQVDPTTTSRYRWTSSGGPPTRIQSGTLAAGYVTIQSERPITRLLPMLRRWTGV